MNEIYTKSLTEVRSLLLSREISATEAVQSCLERIKKTEPSVHALLCVDEKGALKQAEELDKTGPSSDKPLWGIPVTIKDALNTKGITTTAASRILKNYVPFYDAYAVERLRDAGAVILGKNNMDEFAMGSSTENSAYGVTHNPHNTDRIPGGSSGGSAASVAACQCFASLGSDTGGSIRQPAAMCGCVGLKPTYGRVSRYGLIAYGSSLDQVGPLARTVNDCAAVLQVIAGHDDRDGTCAPCPTEDYLSAVSGAHDLKNKRIGIPKEFFGDGLSAEVEEQCKAAISTAEKLGAEIIPVSLPHTNEAIAAYYIIAMAEASSNLARFDGVRYGQRAEACNKLEDLYILSRSQGFGEEVQRRILLGTYVLSSGYYDAYYRKAAQVRRIIRDEYESALTQCDVLCAPASPVTAWKIGEHTQDPLQMYLMDIYTLSLNLAGLPGLCIPVGNGAVSGMPVGLQFFGKAFKEAELLGIGAVLENALPKLAFPNL